MNRFKEWLSAVVWDFRGIICWKCHRLNDNFDDLGWWYYYSQVRCNKCFPWEEHHGER